jgi:hypothetical protein
MHALGWVLLLFGLVFGVAGGAANIALAQNYGEFWTVSVPVAVVGLGLGWYLINHGREDRTTR